MHVEEKLALIGCPDHRANGRFWGVIRGYAGLFVLMDAVRDAEGQTIAASMFGPGPDAARGGGLTEEAQSSCPGDHLRPAVGAELAVDIRRVGLHRAVGDVELVGDLAIGPTGRE